MVMVDSEQAARMLGVTRRQVARLVEAAELDGQHLGRALLIDAASVNRLAVSTSRRGRPWEQATAWAALAMLSGLRDAGWVDGHTRSRLRARLRSMAAEDLVVRARRRAHVTHWRASQDALNEMGDYLVLTGRSALSSPEVASRFDLAGGSAEGTLEGYLLESDVQALVDSFALSPDPAGQVTLRAVSHDRWLPDGTAPMAAVALDLMEAPSTRYRSAGARVLNEMLAGA
jgi:hypothetical protein